MPDSRKEQKKRQYEQRVSFQTDNREARGQPENQNDGHNVRRQSLGPNTQRDKR